jgi:hypothetical protein
MEHKCDICNKIFSSRQSRWNHNNRLHKLPDVQMSTQMSTLGLQMSTSGLQMSTILPVKNNLCKYCTKEFCDRKSRWRHEKSCKSKEDVNNEIKILTMEKEIKELRNIIQQSLKIDKKELNKINNQLNLNQQNNINNNYFQLGYENFNEKLSDKRKLGILNRQANSVNSFVEMIYQNKDFKPYQNVYIANLRSNIAYKYDEKLNKFIAVKQKEVIDDLFETRLYDIQQFYDELQEVMDPIKANQMKIFLERIENELVYRNIKKEEVKLVLYNNKDSVKKIFEEFNKEIDL